MTGPRAAVLAPGPAGGPDALADAARRQTRPTATIPNHARWWCASTVGQPYRGQTDRPAEPNLCVPAVLVVGIELAPEPRLRLRGHARPLHHGADRSAVLL